MKHSILQYRLEQGALEVEYMEEYFSEFRQKKLAKEIVRRLQDREHLILLSMAYSPDGDGREIPVAFKVGHELGAGDPDPQLSELAGHLMDCVKFAGRKIFYSWIGGTRDPWRGQGHYRALTEQQEEWAYGRGYDELVVKTKNKFYAMRATLDQMNFNVIKYQPHPHDIAEAKLYLSKILSPGTIERHLTERSIVESA